MYRRALLHRVKLGGLSRLSIKTVFAEIFKRTLVINIGSRSRHIHVEPEKLGCDFSVADFNFFFVNTAVKCRKAVGVARDALKIFFKRAVQNVFFLRQLRHNVKSSFDALDSLDIINVNGVNNSELREKLLHLCNNFRGRNLCAVDVLAKICNVKSVGG